MPSFPTILFLAFGFLGGVSDVQAETVHLQCTGPAVISDQLCQAVETILLERDALLQIHRGKTAVGASHLLVAEVADQYTARTVSARLVWQDVRQADPKVVINPFMNFAVSDATLDEITLHPFARTLIKHSGLPF